MPYKSEAQKRLMQAVAHSKTFAAKVGVPQSVGREFAAADAREHGRKGVAQALTEKRRAK